MDKSVICLPIFRSVACKLNDWAINYNTIKLCFSTETSLDMLVTRYTYALETTFWSLYCQGHELNRSNFNTNKTWQFYCRKVSVYLDKKVRRPGSPGCTCTCTWCWGSCTSRSRRTSAPCCSSPRLVILNHRYDRQFSYRLTPSITPIIQWDDNPTRTEK